MAETEIIDVSLADKKVIRMVAIQPRGEIHEFYQQIPIPEEVMGVLDPYLGDGKATVTVGAEVATSIEFGFKAQAFVSMTVTCDNNLDNMTAVRDVLLQHIGDNIEPAHNYIAAVRDKLLDEYLAKKNGQSPAPDKITSGPPSKALPAPRPSFRR